MKIEVTNLFGTFTAKVVENLYLGGEWAGVRAEVTDSKLDGWRNGDMIECGTLTEFRYV